MKTGDFHEILITESKLGLLQYSDARQRKGLLMAPLSPRDVTSCHVELFTFSRQCSQHCLIYLFLVLSQIGPAVKAVEFGLTIS